MAWPKTGTAWSGSIRPTAMRHGAGWKSWLTIATALPWFTPALETAGFYRQVWQRAERVTVPQGPPAFLSRRRHTGTGQRRRAVGVSGLWPSGDAAGCAMLICWGNISRYTDTAHRVGRLGAGGWPVMRIGARYSRRSRRPTGVKFKKLDSATLYVYIRNTLCLYPPGNACTLAYRPLGYIYRHCR